MQQSTLPRISITPALMDALDANEQIGPLVVGETADACTLVALAGPVLGCDSDDCPTRITSPGSEMAIVVGRDGFIRTRGITESDAIDLLREVERAFLAA